VEDFFQGLHGTIRQSSIRLNKEISNIALPGFVHFKPCHTTPQAFKIFCFEIANPKAIIAQE